MIIKFHRTNYLAEFINSKNRKLEERWNGIFDSFVTQQKGREGLTNEISAKTLSKDKGKQTVCPRRKISLYIGYTFTRPITRPVPFFSRDGENFAVKYRGERKIVCKFSDKACTLRRFIFPGIIDKLQREF